MTHEEEGFWSDGNLAAWRRVFSLASQELGINDARVAAGVIELEETREALRDLFKELGIESEYDNDLYLPDLVSKHLMRNIQAIK